MFKNFLKIAVRNFWRNKVLSFINVLGLSIGMAGAILLLLNIQFELSVDQFHKNKNFIYKAYYKGDINGRLESWDITAPPLGPILKKSYPAITAVTRVASNNKLFSYGEVKINASGSYTDTSFLNIFTFPLLKGNPQLVLKDPQSIVITERFAKKMFGNEDPINKVLIADNKENCVVTGVLKDLPNNTDFNFEYLQGWRYLDSNTSDNSSWDHTFVKTFVQVIPSVDINSLNNKIKDVVASNTNRKQKYEIFLYALENVHLRNRFENGKPVGGNIENVRTLAILAVIVLLIACINFMNLSTARSDKRAKEVGVRKVIGASKKSLIFQFIGESVLLALVAGIIGMLIVQIALPQFNVILGIRLAINYLSPLFWVTGLSFILITGLLAGSYPAFYLSSFKPIRVLKGVFNNGNALITPRKVLVIIQFVFSILLINFTIIVKKQMKHSQSREIGFTKDNLIFHPLTADLKRNYAPLKNELISSGSVVSVSKSNTPITREATEISGLKWNGQDLKQNVNFQLLTTRQDFVKTNGLLLLAGRDIDFSAFPGDTASCVINETAAKALGFKDPIGQTIKDNEFNWSIVGVVKDFLIGSPMQVINPTLIRGSDDANYVSIRLHGNAQSVENVKKAEAILRKYNPNFITEYQFADDDYAAKFKQAENAGILIDFFAAITIFISCMGLFGLATYMAENRIKEIGIRKALGASVASIYSLLAKYFLKLVVLAIVIASPISWLFMNFFLKQFDYRTDISWWVLVAAGGLALAVAMLTISFQSIKAARSNPTKSLRAE